MDRPRAVRTRAVSSKRRAGAGRTGLRLAVHWMAFLPLAGRMPDYARLIWALVRDSRVPASRKAVLAMAGGYVLIGRDLIPDDIPIVGRLDDLVVVVLAVEVFFDGVPEDVMEEKLLALGIDRLAFQHDMDQVRRFTPAPVRNLIRRLPIALDAAGRLIKQSGVGPRVRSWARDARPSRPSKEESFA